MSDTSKKNQIEIYVLGGDKESVWVEHDWKGWLGFVYIKIAEGIQELYVQDINSFVQDAKAEIEADGFVYTLPNTIFVNKITKENIIRTIEGLYQKDYFNYVKPIPEKKIREISTLHTQEKITQIY